MGGLLLPRQATHSFSGVVTTTHLSTNTFNSFHHHPLPSLPSIPSRPSQNKRYWLGTMAADPVSSTRLYLGNLPRHGRLSSQMLWRSISFPAHSG
jgi:hypothetical protein